MNKFGSYDQNLMNILSIKSEIDIKEEPLESHEEYLTEDDMKFVSENHQIEASGISTNGIHLEKPCGINVGKIEVKQEDKIDEVHDAIIEDNDYDINSDIDVKYEDIEDYIEDQSHNLKILEKNNVDMKSEITSEPKRSTEAFDFPSPISPRPGNVKRNIIELKNEEREKLENKIKDFESRKRIKLGAKFECSLCDYKTNLDINLKLHSLEHSTIKLFKCSECGYECNHKSNYKIHLLTRSNNMKLFICSKCDYRCSTKNEFKRHLLAHFSSPSSYEYPVPNTSKENERITNEFLSENIPVPLSYSQISQESNDSLFLSPDALPSNRLELGENAIYPHDSFQYDSNTGSTNDLNHVAYQSTSSLVKSFESESKLPNDILNYNYDYVKDNKLHESTSFEENVGYYSQNDDQPRDYSYNSVLNSTQKPEAENICLIESVKKDALNQVIFYSGNERSYEERRTFAKKLLSVQVNETERKKVLQEKFWIVEDEPLKESILMKAAEAKEDSSAAPKLCSLKKTFVSYL